jgi:SpoVK/Ycf46/Vps4 family AAA+-type ATPase
MSLNEALIYDVYQMHHQAARKEHAKGNYVEAKKSYLHAAEAMLKLAKISEGSLRTARLDKARKIAIVAQNLEGSSLAKKENNEGSVKNESTWKPISLPQLRFDDIAGLDDVKHMIRVKMIYPLLHRETYQMYGKKSGGGILLYGPPGTGKTMIARAIAHEVNAAFYVVKPSDILSKYVGESEQQIKSLFETVNQEERAVVFFDELDGLFKKRGSDEHNDRRIAEFLQHIDGFEVKNNTVLILGASNRPWDIDEAARRPGRFSQSVYIPLPDDEAKILMIQKAIVNVPGYQAVNASDVVKYTTGFSGADIDELCDQAKEYPLMKSIQTQQIEALTLSDFIEAANMIKPSVSQSELDKFEKFKQTQRGN